MEVLLSHIQLDADLKSVLTPKSILRRQNSSVARSERSAKTVQNSYCFLMFPILVTNLCVSLFVRGVYHHLNENKLSNILFTGVLIENSASSQSDMPD